MLCPLLKCFILEDPSASPFSSIGVVLGRGQGYIEPAVGFINLGFFHSKGKTSKISHATDPKMEEKWSQRSYLFSWHAPLLQYMDELLRHRVEGRRGATRLTYLALAHVCPRSVLVRRGSEGAGRLPTIGLAPMHCTTVSWSLVPVAAWGKGVACARLRLTDPSPTQPRKSDLVFDPIVEWTAAPFPTFV